MKKPYKALFATCLVFVLANQSGYTSSTNRHTESWQILPKSTKPIKPIQIEIAPVAALEPISPSPVTILSNSTQNSGSRSEWLSKLRNCESGGNYATNTGNSFYGAYQFTIDTWDSVGTAYSRADLAPADVQDQAIIENTNRSAGGLASQNPGCYQKEGLSAFPPN